MNKKIKNTLFVVMACMVSMSAAHAVVIDTTSSWNGTDVVYPFGETNTATYGQTFTVTGADVYLNSFTFYLNDRLDPDYVDFAAYVYAWDGNSASGSALYTSAAMSTTNNGGAGGFEAININTGGIQLTSGQQYVALFSASAYFDGAVGLADVGWMANASAYTGGAFVYYNNGSNFGLLTTNTWNGLAWGGDLAFMMDLSATPVASAVPVPAAAWLFGSGLMGLVGISRHRARTS
jgi:hypothetical protein